MDKKYLYRVHLRKAPNVMLGLIIIGIILIFLGFLNEFFFVIGGFITLYSALLYFFFKRFSTSSFTLTDTALIYVNNKHNVTLPYDQIKAIDSKSIKNTGGWLNIIPISGKTIKVTVVLEDVDDLVLSLKTLLDEQHLSNLYEEEKLFGFYKTAAYSNDSWRRSYFFTPKMFLMVFVHMVLVTIYGDLTSNTTVVLWGFAAMFIMLCHYLYIEYCVFASKLKTISTLDWKLPEPEISLERKLLKRVLYGYVIGIIIFFIIGM